MKSPIRVLLVDDSNFICYHVTKHLESAPGLQVVGTANNGLEALNQIKTLRPDVVVLDIEMPRLDGLSTLRRIMAECPTPVIMFSVLTQRGARATIQAMMMGAVDFVRKPEAKEAVYTVVEELAAKIKAAVGTQLTKLSSAETAPLTQPAKLGLQRFQKGDRIIVIGASTGGPRALQAILSQLPADIPAAVLVVQHMPSGFTHSLAQRLHQMSAVRVQEAADGDRLARGLVLLAPGDYHLCLTKTGQVRLNQGPRRHYVRPSVDVTMESAVESFGSAVIGVILTGMGNDGTDGAKYIKDAGGKVVAEDESTTIVNGMPLSAIEAGWVDQVAPLPKIAPIILKLVKNGTAGV